MTTGEPFDKLSPSDQIVLQEDITDEYYVDNVTVDIIVTKKAKIFKPMILHPENISWDPYHPICEQFEELHPIKCTCPHLLII